MIIRRKSRLVCGHMSSCMSVAAWGHAALIAFALGLIWIGIWVHLNRSYRAAEQNALEDTANMALVMEETFLRSIATIDQALLFIRDAYARDPEHFNLHGWASGGAFLNELSLQLVIADASGDVVQSNLPLRQPVSIADREHFLVHAGAGQDRIFISKPLVGRVSNRISIQFTRRIAAADGHFMGVAVASLDPLTLSRFYQAFQIGRGFILLTGDDGIVRAGRPNEDLIGHSLAGSTLLSRAAAASSGSYSSAPGPAADAGAIVSFRRIPALPLAVAVGFSLEDVLGECERDRRQFLAAGGILTAFITVMGMLLVRHRWRLDRSQQALGVTLENISQGLIMVDRHRRIPVVNRRVTELLGVPSHLARTGGDFDALLRWQDAHDGFDTASQAREHSAMSTAEGGLDLTPPFHERTRADGTVLEVRTSVLPDGGAVRTYTDITERKRIERDLAAARDVAEAAGRARAEFLALISHEILTPLNGIIGVTELLLDRPLGEEERRFGEIIRDSGNHLRLLIDDVLDFSRLDAERMTLEQAPFDLHALLGGTIDMLTPQASAKGLSVHCSIAANVPRRVVGDAGRLRQILVNLIGNGIKFTERGSVAVGITVALPAAASVRLAVSVADTGIGIALEAQPKLFSAFTQADASVSRRFDGTGLGLAICKQLVGLMGGTISLESAPGRGSTFRFEVPLPLDAGAPAELNPAVRVEPKALRLLIVEDNATNRLVATRMARRMGHQAEAVNDGEEAIESLRTTAWDVVLMDVMMPGMDGLMATRLIRVSGGAYANTPIIGLTASAQPEDEAACRAAGMNGFVTKPVTADRLAAAITAAIGGGAPGSDAVLVDLGYLDQLIADISLEGVAEAIGLFREDAPVRLAALHRALAARSITVLRREAHALAGAARNVGLAALGDFAYALQKAVEITEPDHAAFDRLTGLVGDSLREITAWEAARTGKSTIAAMTTA
jgi:signal transduction histidine kinase/CheY-like chemotaxis protein